MTTTLNKLIKDKEKEFDELWQTNPATPEFSEYDNHKHFSIQCIQSGYELAIKDVIDMVKENRQGTFIDDGGNDCWYIDELVKQLQSLLKGERRTGTYIIPILYL
jgi:hypothetical protein